MAKYDVTYKCGHTATVQLYGKSADRDKKIAQLENQICPDCYKAQRDAAAKEQAEALHLPDLMGSEKQVAWANSLWNDVLRKLQKSFDGIKEPARTQMNDWAVKWVASQIEAKYWINSRDEMLDYYKKSMGEYMGMDEIKRLMELAK